MHISHRWVGAVAALFLVLTGCASGGPATEPAPSPSGSHTMADGSVMSDQEMAAMDTDREPSPAAQMVCTGNVREDVGRILGLDDPLEPTSRWHEPMFTCTYQLSGGPLVLSVHDATDPDAGRKHFEALRKRLGDTTTLEGMLGLGFPAYETGDGITVFLKDGKTLEVDATALPNHLGPGGDMSRSDLAYAVASSVVACWTEHTG